MENRLTRSVIFYPQDHERARSHQFEGHVILCLQRHRGDPEIGLVNFVKPLRASSFKYEELKDIIIIGDPEYMVQEWKHIANFPKLWVFTVSARHLQTNNEMEH